MISKEKMEEWGYTLDRHLHYGPAVQAATHAFQVCFANFQALKKTDWNAATYWSKESQQAWNRMVKCRKEETGHPFYLDPEQYQETVREFTR